MKLLTRQDGQALALAFMILAVPLITTALAFSSTISLDSQVKNRNLKDQYSALGTKQIALHLLVQTPSKTTVYINDRPVTSTVAKLIEVPLGEIPLSPRIEGRPITSKVAFPTSTASNATTTYTITVENEHDKAVDLDRIKNEPSGNFSYIPG